MAMPTGTVQHLTPFNSFSPFFHLPPLSPSRYTPSSSSSSSLYPSHLLRSNRLLLKARQQLPPPVPALPFSMFSENPVAADLIATALSGGVALSLLRLWVETARRNVFDPKVNRKLVHISIGLAFMLCWPLFSAAPHGAIFAALVPGVNAVKVLLVGLGILKDEAMVKSMSRYGDHRELLKGPFYYAATISLACAIYWRNSPISVAAICNLCAGDGLADIVGRRFGSQKLPYNRHKSIAGSIAFTIGGFLASVGLMHYLASFGYIVESWRMVLGFLAVSVVSALVESHPLSTELDDNLAVPLASLLVGVFVF